MAGFRLPCRGRSGWFWKTFGYSRRSPSRTAAARGLLRRGLAAEGFEVEACSAKSKGFDLVGPSAKAPNSE